MWDRKQDRAYSYCHRDRHLILEELQNDTSAKHFLHGSLENESAKHQKNVLSIDIRKHTVIRERTCENHSDDRHSQKGRSDSSTGKICARFLRKSEFCYSLLLDQFPVKEHNPDKERVTIVHDQHHGIRAEHFPLQRILSAGKKRGKDDTFTDQFGSEFHEPEYKDDLDDVEYRRHFCFVVKWAYIFQ